MHAETFNFIDCLRIFGKTREIEMVKKRSGFMNNIIDSEENKSERTSVFYLPVWVKNIVVLAVTVALLAVVGVMCYKVARSDVFKGAFDFSSLLALCLALFSVALSSMFYFKASETSKQTRKYFVTLD